MSSNSPGPFHEWISLAQPRLGARVVYTTDEFFAPGERLINSAEPVFLADKYDDHGKWMDGWESRRRRGPGHDFCIIRLGMAAVIHGVDIDTRYFTGNYPQQASLEGCRSEQEIPDESTKWEELVAGTDLQGDQHHWIRTSGDGPYTHIRLHIYPDGGIARLRLYGAVPPPPQADSGLLDLVALGNGGRAIACSDEHYGSMQNLVLPGRSLNMGDGWETARRRGPGNDWVVLALGRRGKIEKIDVDTEHFKGNYPDRVAVDAVDLGDIAATDINSISWQPLLPESKLQMHQLHEFTHLQECPAATHVRMRIFPDGGVSRLRVFGRIVQ